MNIKVGDTVWWDHVNSGRAGAQKSRETKVTKIGRVYFEVECDRYNKFRIDNGSARDNRGYYYVLSLEEKLRRERVAAARLALRNVGFDVGFGRRVDDDLLFAVHEVIKQYEETKREQP
jgi:hypothetical protein